VAGGPHVAHVARLQQAAGEQASTAAAGDARRIDSAATARVHIQQSVQHASRGEV
jgi:hypothetical protein